MMSREIMDNFALDVRARSRESFDHAMAIAFNGSVGKASHWCEHPKFGLVFFWNEVPSDTFQGKPISPLMTEMDAAQAADLAWIWLQKADRKKFQLKDSDEHYRDGDVDNEKAWRVYVEEWGHVGGSNYAVCAILPVWAWLGK